MGRWRFGQISLQSGSVPLPWSHPITGVAVDQKIARQRLASQQHAVDHTFTTYQTDSNTFSVAPHHHGGFNKQSLLAQTSTVAHNLPVDNRGFQLTEIFLLATEPQRKADTVPRKFHKFCAVDGRSARAAICLGLKLDSPFRELNRFAPADDDRVIHGSHRSGVQ